MPLSQNDDPKTGKVKKTKWKRQKLYELEVNGKARKSRRMKEKKELSHG